MAKSPLSIVKDKFGDKEKLVAAVEKLTGEDLWVSRTNKEKGLGHVSNAKLLRLHETFTAVKEKFGTRAKLIDAILEVEKRTKDEGYKTHLSAFPVPRLWDLYKSTSKRHAPAPAKKPAAKKPAAKAATGKGGASSKGGASGKGGASSKSGAGKSSKSGKPGAKKSAAKSTKK